ncbi:NAD-glutamate dehydrogenase [Legionella jordanis]|uniref:NAD-glutamate dehydrogenase n=1 Tax=Legionella jordanis TaxID=456 RepID=A0A0W0VB68_9GAMM|nr:NAD-glutamate dehydrogenase [Legionella jordanis]KTD17149.1 NAD-glutamate dehydrogenase [Legionella jordanis]RMX03273.1 NAD-glutamate dehydrogenase [Legionella jordanis]RMX18251.1 NAD-glutamate dehydrogenase [Legionella jordanis]VEH12653.1 NAD-glutamate dehydrogenase [Legionella jordanis]
MSYKFEEGKDLIIDAVVDRVKQKMEGEQALFCAEFVRQFYGTVALEDLRDWDIEDLYGAAVNFWSLIQKRAPEETKIRIYNPDFERHGWQTTHTVVEIITEDMPFLVDSLRMVINRLGLISHLIMHMGGLRLQRNKQNEVIGVLPRKTEEDSDVDGVSTEAAIFIEIDRQTDASVLEDLHSNFERVLEDNRVVVKDWPAMRQKVREAIGELDEVSSILDPNEASETKAFLHWIEDHHFTFLGIRDYELVEKGQETILQPLPETGLGVLRQSMSKSSARSISAMTPEARELTLSTRILVMSKTNTEATVHRRAYTDYIGIKRFNEKGQVIGERRIIGLYTSAAYNTNPKHIPFLRHKVALIMKNSRLNPHGHAGKVLLNILETLPRDDLIQGSEDELLEIAMGIYYMQERRRIRMFARTDVYRRFVSCLVYVPKERFNTELREAMQKILEESFNSHEITFSTWFSESVLARIHFIIRTNPQDTTHWDFKEIEQRLIEVGRTWTDDLQHFLFETFGEEHANRLYARYKTAFPVAYTSNFTPRTAVYDIKHIETLSADNPLVMNFYKLMDEKQEYFRLKIYQHEHTIPLSDVLPIVERLGMRAISERPYPLKFEDGRETWINDFALQYTRGNHFEIDEIKDLFQNALANVWFGNAENDGFNQLVLAAKLDSREVAILRTYAKYFKQIGFTFSQEYIESALCNNAHIAKKLVQLFNTRFNPSMQGSREEAWETIHQEILSALDEVSNLDEDKIIRQYVQVIRSTLRTNYYQTDIKGNHKNYISIKLNSRDIPGVPKPYPMFEIFVYSPRFEGVHLRGGRVARGGLRWSDRREDFRTEILGLMKAQQVKNAVIVPSGAKGGFVPKQLPVNGTREEILAEGVRCYQSFIRGLLDITDNYKQGLVIKPLNVVSYDEDDPYLVVAADKGTATFSDIANEISFEYGFWLGDAFASGGSVGYDHKKMGITARGAWESVKRHFYEMGRDIQNHDFTVVGIGDMAGDVFGNGMLLSRHIKLLGAFNHMHIFVDPNPDPETSFLERERLFNLPRSTWADYDKKLISKGGGVFNRSAKSIAVTKEMKEAFNIKQATVEPNELIRILLRAKVDLLWSAGIGTFVKAQTESHIDVGDRTNDAIRINGKQLRCKVVGEGGNLGLTQLGRVEYALNGGRIYTDFIDNSAGVNCSDKEVNIKILLNNIVASGDLTEKQRNELLSEMTQEVAALVLKDNFAQPRAISLAASQAAGSVELHSRYIHDLERSGKLDRELEYLPNEKALMERKLMGKGLTNPGIASLLCYSKTILKEQILASNVPEDSFLKDILISSFPKPLQERFSKQMQDHPLKREIIATRLSNLIVNEMGFTFVYRLQDETGAPVSAIVRAYMIARSIMDLEKVCCEIAELGNLITAETQNGFMMLYVRLLRRVTRWFLRSQRMRLNISKAVKYYGPGVKAFKKALPEVLSEGYRAQYDRHHQYYLELGIPADLAHELTITRALFSALDVIEVSHQTGIDVPTVAEVYFGIGEFLDLAWIRQQVISHPTESHWEALSREALRDDLDWQQRQLTAGIINLSEKKKDFMKSFAAWSESHLSLIERWRNVLADLRSSGTLTYTMFFVAIRELLDLTQTTQQMASKELA